MFLNLHNLVRLELVNEPDEIRQFFRCELGIFETNSLDEEPDIRISFTDKIELGSGVRFVGTLVGTPIGTTAAYDDESLCITNLGRKVSLPVGNLAKSKYELTCETGIYPPELYDLLPFFFIQHVLLRKNATFVHSSAVSFNDKGLLFPAWGGVGKTSLVLKFLKEGAEFISDELTIVKGDGTMLAYPSTLNLFDYNYRASSLPLISKESRFLNPGYVLRSILKKILPTLGKILRKMPTGSLKGAGFIASQYGRKIQPSVKVPFSTLFPQAKIRRVSSLDAVFFLIATGGSEIEIAEAKSDFVIDKILCCLLREINSVVPGLYEVFRFAFPGEGRRLMEEREKKVSEIINEAFKGKRICQVKLPLNFDLNQAFAKLIKYL